MCMHRASGRLAVAQTAAPGGGATAAAAAASAAARLSWCLNSGLQNPGWVVEWVLSLTDGWKERSVGQAPQGRPAASRVAPHAPPDVRMAPAGPASTIQVQFPATVGLPIHLEPLPGPSTRPGRSQQQLPRVSGCRFPVAGHPERQPCTAGTSGRRSTACHGCAAGRAAQVHRGEGGCGLGGAALRPAPCRAA